MLFSINYKELIINLSSEFPISLLKNHRGHQFGLINTETLFRKMPTTAEPVVKLTVNSNEMTEKTKTIASELVSHLNLLQVARGHNDRRLVSRVIQHLPQVRRQLTTNILINLVQNSSISGKELIKLFIKQLIIF